MVIWANGLPWFVVYKEAYILCGSWMDAGYLLADGVPRKDPAKSISDVFQLGLVLAPPEAVLAARVDSTHPPSRHEPR